MPSTDEKIGEPKPASKEYVDIILSESEIDKKFTADTGLPSKIVYYCRTCEKIVSPKRIGKKFQFSCTLCNGVDVAFGSEKSIYNYYKIPTGELEKKA